MGRCEGRFSYKGGLGGGEFREGYGE